MKKIICSMLMIFLLSYCNFAIADEYDDYISMKGSITIAYEAQISKLDDNRTKIQQLGDAACNLLSVSSQSNTLTSTYKTIISDDCAWVNDILYYTSNNNASYYADNVDGLIPYYGYCMDEALFWANEAMGSNSPTHWENCVDALYEANYTVGLMTNNNNNSLSKIEKAWNGQNNVSQGFKNSAIMNNNNNGAMETDVNVNPANLPE